MIQTVAGLKIPAGTRWRANLPRGLTTVWPALSPPCARMTTFALPAKRSMILPLPSSPHWPPTTATTAIRLHQSSLATWAVRDYNSGRSTAPPGPELTVRASGASGRPAGRVEGAFEIVAAIPVLVLAGLQLFPPGRVLPIPPDRCLKRLVEVVAGLPAELAKLRNIQTIATVVAGAIRNEPQQ